MPEPQGVVAVAFREHRGPRRRIRFTPVERATEDGVYAKTLEEWTGCGWQIQSREYVDDLSLEVDTEPVRVEAGP